VLFNVFRGCLRGKRFVVHRICRLFGFRGIRLVIVMQRVLQIFELRRFDKRFGGCFFRFRLIFTFRLSFFVLGFGKLLSERAYLIVGKARAVLGVDFRSVRNFRFGLEFWVSHFRHGNPRRRGQRRLTA
jgi:hypothetical protein